MGNTGSQDAQQEPPRTPPRANCLPPSVVGLLDPTSVESPIAPEAVQPVAQVEDRLGKYAITIESVLSAEECARLIDATEVIGYEEALVNVGFGKQVRMTDLRNSERCIVDDPAAAEIIWQRIRQFVPRIAPQRKGFRAVGLNERLRFLKYGDGQYFAPHQDGCFVRGAEAEVFGRRGEQSYITLQLYLTAPAAEGRGPGRADNGNADDDSDGAAFHGGATRFFHPASGDKAAGGEEDEEDEDEHTDVIPAVGRALLFQHNILHEGSIVHAPRERGRGECYDEPRGDAAERRRFKYAIRTDVMYTAAEGEIEELEYRSNPVPPPVPVPVPALQSHAS